MIDELTLRDVLGLEADAELAFAEEGEEAEEDPPNPVLPTFNEILFAAIFFFALWGAMKYFLYPPVRRTMLARAAAVRDDEDAAERARDELAAVQQAYDAALADARVESTQIIEAARTEAEAYRAEVMGGVEAELAAARSAAQAEVEAARAKALGGVRNDVAELAVAAASSVLGRQLDPASQRAVVDRALGTDGS